MKANAAWLKANPKVKIKIAGNCGERDTKEHNQVSGQRRSASAKKYLVAMGISANHISLVGYRKEKLMSAPSKMKNAGRRNCNAPVG
jgi:Outer membrane protein and related peptidoglycan-associated (lipo)proteins